MRNKDFEIVRQYMYDTFDITDIVYLFYQGAIAGSEFVTYASTKLYLCLSLNINSNTSNVNSGVSVLNIWDENNIQFNSYVNVSSVYNSGTPVVECSKLTNRVYNVYFSRISVTQYIYMDFRGYRITIP